MEPSELSWRNPYYVTYLDKVLALYLELNKRQQIGSSPNHWPNTSVFALLRSPPPIPQSTKSLVSNSHGGNLGASPASRTSRVLVDFSQRDNSAPPSEIGSQGLTFPPPIALPTSVSEVEYCRPCSKAFKGTPQTRKSNFLRHIKTSREHNKDAVYICPMPGCNSKRRRTDNLNKHLKTAHGMLSRSERRQAIGASKRMVS